MKSLNWKQWTAIGVSAAAVITEVVLCFVQPWSAVWGAILFVAGGVAGYLLKDKGIIKADNAAE